MIKRKYTSMDGDCFAETYLGTCDALTERCSRCGSYICPFYKPKECKDWIRLDRPKYVELYTPEEYYSGEAKQR